MATVRLRKVLLVEDDESIQHIARLALELVGGFTVDTACNGRDALQQVSHFQPDLILLDVMMPSMDGPSTLAALHADPSTAKIPVIFLTGKAQAQEIAEFKSLGILDVLFKPFDPLVLVDTIKAVWSREYGTH